MSTAFRTLDDLDVAGRRVIVRLDLNVPFADGRITDATRIERVVPTLKEIIDRGAAIVLLSHFGRPKGRVVAGLSLAPLAGPLSDALDRPVQFVPTDWSDNHAAAAAAGARPGDVLLIENTRFAPGEEKNDAALAARMAALGDLYVNDAFSCAHRAHASTEGIAHLLPSAAGRAMQAELAALARALTSPERPLLALIGGAKVSTKLDLLANLSGKVDGLIIGGGMANTFLAAKGIAVGKSLCEHDLAGTARSIIEAAEKAGCEIILPDDVVVAREFAAGAAHRVVPAGATGDEEMILDIGPASVAGLCGRLDAARTLVWNGPLGAFEIAPFDAGTTAVARHAAGLTAAGRLVSVAGGGDTVAALARAGVSDRFTYVSTAGGAFLEWLEGKDLPGVRILMQTDQ